MSKFSNEYGGAEEAFDIAPEQSKTRAWSVAALVLAVISILCCCVYWLGLFSGACAVACAIVSRRKLGYFDGLSVGAIIVAIFGIVFSAVMTYVNVVVMNDPEFIRLLTEELKKLGVDYPGLV